jgi:transcription initiation factor TFIID TATA-box-binding protein
MENPKVVLLIFVSGKIVFTGAKSREQVYQSFEKIYPLLVRYDKSKAVIKK